MRYRVRYRNTKDEQWQSTGSTTRHDSEVKADLLSKKNYQYIEIIEDEDEKK